MSNLNHYTTLQKHILTKLDCLTIVDKIQRFLKTDDKIQTSNYCFGEGWNILYNRNSTATTEYEFEDKNVLKTNINILKDNKNADTLVIVIKYESGDKFYYHGFYNLIKNVIEVEEKIADPLPYQNIDEYMNFICVD